MTEEQIRAYIDKKHDENVQFLTQLSNEMQTFHAAQDKKLDELLKAFNNTTGFFKVSVTIAKYIIVMGSAIAVVWGGISFLKK